jgi:hypothetical protein
MIAFYPFQFQSDAVRKKLVINNSRLHAGPRSENKRLIWMRPFLSYWKLEGSEAIEQLVESQFLAPLNRF